MAQSITLKANIRKAVGKSAVKKLRANGRIPAILYGKKSNLPLEIPATELRDLFHGKRVEKVLLNLEIIDTEEKKSTLAFLQEIQLHPITDKLVHLDLHELSSDEKLHAEIDLVFIGEPQALKSGTANLDISLRRLKISCFPKDLPNTIPVSIEQLKTGESLHVADIPLPPGVECLNPKNQVVLSLVATKGEEEMEAPTGETAEPEVIKEKKPKTEESKGE
ncbi:50S ribosomal protein L25 [Candidatus Methylacidiphilum fumarolicum]|uniref:Large ribosomal subunit protein bL25 n=2 Tax=Candidatus Methylacidiphilum fumarolicum TaxID=591154 RepID=I0JX66_METFB|nr:50S ribosomal protein L25 [Candidatus Methylacidiphilum fumarolicum]MBW6415689.1 50S ribosomal protein L25 [Candidatus Methylacidiphilum fumarolicum]TFE67553.1 50S ribosomal protein L25 [Candidatus Methylacidiphilum fumarolicum]TFE71614.1 50S ribosomal protein L25 [Candidatus Methylacidiphilum fumarolicum]TFE73604.1 50S ribosomal protein L25 [Candidatus Methylacidiphilum fumarolicum]TFE75332.1 50S ribosomal protein L25 [Candidatus Methylacidiphilum fumarolicum]